MVLPPQRPPQKPMQRTRTSRTLSLPPRQRGKLPTAPVARPMPRSFRLASRSAVPMGMSYCSPITTLGGPALAPGENPFGDGRFFEYLYGYPLIDFARGISPSQQPVHVVVRNCRDMDPVEVITVTPPPPDTNGSCPAGLFLERQLTRWLPAVFTDVRRFSRLSFPIARVSNFGGNPPTVTGPSPTTTITHGSGTTLISRVPRTPLPPVVAWLPPSGPNKIGKPIPGKNPCTSSHHHPCKPGTGTMNSGTSHTTPSKPGKAP